MAGRMNLVQRTRPRTPIRLMASRRSLGMADAPAITLNRMYHCAPSAISKMPPKFRLMPAAMKNAAAIGNTKFAGNEARTCTTGCARRDTRGFIPIHTPTGTQMTLATISSTTTRAKVAAPSTNTWPKAPSPRCTFR